MMIKKMIEYLTPFLPIKMKNYRRDEVEDIELEKGRWLLDFSSVINIKYKGEWISFEILDKKLKAELKGQIIPLLQAAAKSINK